MSIISLFDRPTEFVNHWLETKPMAAMDKAVEDLIDTLRNSPKSFIGNVERLTCKLLTLVIRVVRWTYFALLTLIDSRTVDLAQDTFWFAYGLWGIIEDREIASSDMVGDENAMTFGQIMPILLLGSIVLVLREAYDGM